MSSRRAFLGTASLTAVAGVAGVAALRGCDSTTGPTSRPRATCVAKSSLDTHDSLGPAALVYEEDRRPRTFAFDGDFHAQLVDWLAAWGREAGGLGGVTAIDTYGSWTDGGASCGSWHNSGRAFDIARLRAGGATLVSCRQDLWSALDAAQLAAHRRAYWRLAAHLHTRFAYVLTYLFDDLHRNHIHVDNGVSGTGAPRFDTRSRVQNQAVQASCAHVWGQPCAETGQWDAATRRASRAVLERLGRTGDLTRGDNWHVFMGATAARE